MNIDFVLLGLTLFLITSTFFLKERRPIILCVVLEQCLSNIFFYFFYEDPVLLRFSFCLIYFSCYFLVKTFEKYQTDKIVYSCYLFVGFYYILYTLEPALIYLIGAQAKFLHAASQYVNITSNVLIVVFSLIGKDFGSFVKYKRFNLFNFGERNNI